MTVAQKINMDCVFFSPGAGSGESRQSDEVKLPLMAEILAEQAEFQLIESEKAALGLVFRKGALTQGQLSAETGLTQQSSSRIASKLTDAGFLVESERIATGRRGYPSISFRLNPVAAYAFGLSLTHHAATLSLVNFAGDLITVLHREFSAMTQRDVLSWLDDGCAELRTAHIGENAIFAGLGVAISGSHIGPNESDGYNTPLELDEWAGIDIAALLASRLNLPVWTDNNGNLAALAEAKVGVGRWADSFAYLYISSGVGGGVVLNGELWRGRNGNAGEFAGGLPSNIYPFPNLELLRRVLIANGIELDSVAQLVERFDPSWPGIDDWIARVRDSVSIIASNASAILDVDLIVLGGQMPTSLAERLIPRIEFFDQKRRSVPRPTARIVPAEAKSNAAALGAAILPLQHRFFSSPRNGKD